MRKRNYPTTKQGCKNEVAGAVTLEEAGITKFTIDYEPLFDEAARLKMPYGKKQYGCDRHWSRIVSHSPSRNTLYMEDDAVVPPNFRQLFESHLEA